MKKWLLKKCSVINIQININNICIFSCYVIVRDQVPSEFYEQKPIKTFKNQWFENVKIILQIDLLTGTWDCGTMSK